MSSLSPNRLSLCARLCTCLIAAAALAGCDRPPAPVQASPSADAANTVSPDEAAPAAPAAPVHGADRSHAGAEAPALSFTTLDGHPATLAAHRGHPLLVNLWATWCAPCVKEMPTLDALAKAKGTALAVVPISQDLDGAAKVGPYMARAKLATLHPLLDPKMAFSLALQANLPTSILYGSDGREVWRYTGDLDWTGPVAAKLLAEAK